MIVPIVVVTIILVLVFLVLLLVVIIKRQKIKECFKKSINILYIQIFIVYLEVRDTVPTDQQEDLQLRHVKVKT